MDSPNSVVQGAIAFSFLEVGDCLINGSLVVAQDTNRVETGKVAQIPL